MDVYCWHSVSMERTASNEKVQIVPGVEGPRSVTSTPLGTWSRAGGAVDVQLLIEYDEDEQRYVCAEFTAHRTPGNKGFVTSETLRRPAVGDLVALELRFRHSAGDIKQLPNPDNADPWGWTPPKALAEEGPTDRALQWVAHLYHYGLAMAQNPAKVVEETLKLSHGTAARWIRLARQKDYLGPSEGPGRAAG
jgi:hypothetical protein